MSMIPFSEFKQRRAKLLAQVADNSVIVVCAGKEVTRSRDTEYAFRQNSYFQYLTGFPEPDAWLILEKKGEITKASLVCREKDKVAEIWQGRRIGQVKAKSEYLIDEAYSLDQLDEVLNKALNHKTNLYWIQGQHPADDEIILAQLAKLRASVRQGFGAPHCQIDVRPLIDEMRLFKSHNEINVMRKAGDISCKAHQRAMKFSAEQTHKQQVVTEYQLEAELHHQFAMNKARHPAYGTIVGSGENACILHYTENNADISPSDLVLIDAGCELEGYAADITRTFPAGGRFSPEQKAIYQLVLEAQLAVFEMIKPGVTLKQLTTESVKVITEGLVELGILSGKITELIEQDAHRAYYMHGLSHWLGLDVHDVGQYNDSNGEPRVLEPGMVFTVEPGVYIDSESNCDSKWHGIGVRIEDNIVVTKDGFENLTQAVPKTVEAIEQLMAKSG